ncbi:hypothetical protein [Corynebacterium pacaense]|uniref:hypothetical protein n=1 Tax=Corynebacterium pacaense TaxID=1816684 RepID=UPI001FE5BB49|nr:hypothetical protein [Corynebacterium pacaense]
MKGKVLFSISAAAVLLLSACSPSGQEAAGDASPTTEEAGSITFSHPSIENLQIDFETRPQKLVMDCYS